MAHRILVFESDTAFAQVLRSGFEGRDVALEVVSEGALGLERAAAEPPDLILLSIELPSMNGFLVCKKIKKNAALKSIPLIILSSDANAAEIFEQHKKLRTRAEDYVRKPVSFDDLVAAVRVFVPIGDATTDGHTQVAMASGIDDEIDAFAEDAFDSLLIDDDDIELEVDDVDDMEEATAVVSPEVMEAELAAASAPPPPMASEAPPVPPAPPVPVSEPPRAPSAPPPASIPPPKSVPPDSLPPASVAPQALAALSAVDTAALDEANARLASLESQVAELETEKSSLRTRSESANQKVSKLEGEVAELRTKGATSGVSSREFLDLREQLNTKDKEILDLRDRVSSRDKELVDLRDKNIAVERAKADVDDRALASERKSADLEENLAATQQDKDTANKRADDLKTRFEQSEEKVKVLEDEIETAKATASAQVAAARQEAVETKEAAEKASADAVTAAEAAAEAASADAAKRVSDAEEAAAAKAAAAEEAATAAVSAAEEDAAAKTLAAEQTATAKVTAAEEGAASELASLRAESAAALEAALAGAAAIALTTQADAIAARELELEAERDAALEESETSHSRELAVLGRKLADTESKAEDAASKLAEIEIAKTETDSALEGKVAEVETATGRIDELEGDLAALRATKADLGEQLTAAKAKLAEDEALLERVRKAMAIGLGLLEEQKNNTLEAAE